MATAQPDPIRSDPAQRIPKPAGPEGMPDPAELVGDQSKEMEALIRSESGAHELNLVKAARSELAARLEKRKLKHELAEDADLLRILAEQHGMEYVDLGQVSGIGKDPRVLQLIHSELAKEMKVFPVELKEDGTLVVAISDPLDVTVVDNLRLLTSHEIKPIVASEEEILDRIDLHYGMGDENLEKMVEEYESEGDVVDIGMGDIEVDLSDIEEIVNEPTVIKLVNLLLLNVIKDRASDLHIEPFGGVLRIRYRVDGVLREIQSPPKSLQTGIISRFKVMAGMNIAETRRPQDGRIRLSLSGREIDLRVSSLPTVHGESVVMRILDKSMMMLGLDQIGMSDDALERFSKVIKKPNGIVLVTGPTGSGKTTTLYAAIQVINDPGEKLITTEDPVEYQLPGLIQININEKVGLTFAMCLRSILRQDPDTILVGEVRDVETAQIAIQASLTGHLVFSTLHTNSAAATISRLIDMGVEPFLLTSTIEAVVGQRLVRTVCPACAKPHTPTVEELREFGSKPEDVINEPFVVGTGCEECGQSGYKGRLGLFEVLLASDPIREMVLRRSTADEINAQALEEGMVSMRRDGWMKTRMGITSLTEVAHHTPQEVETNIDMEMDSALRSEGLRQADRAPMPKPAEPSDGGEKMPWEAESGGPVVPQSGTEGRPI